MQIFADQCIHVDVIEALRQAGLKVQRADEVGLERSPDEEIFGYILETHQVLFSFDHDFGNIIRFDIRASAGVVIFYIENLDREAIVKRAVNFFSSIEEKQLRGKLFVIDVAGKIRPWPQEK